MEVAQLARGGGAYIKHPKGTLDDGFDFNYNLYYSVLPIIHEERCIEAA
jgi:hypothetical protein